MLRGLALALLLANLAFFAWTRGEADRGDAPAAPSGAAPDSLVREVRPEAVRLLLPPLAAPAAAPAASTAAPAASAAAAEPSGASADAVTSAASGASTAAAPAPAASAAATAATTLVAAAAVAAAEPPPPPGTRCIEAGPFSGAELAAAETALAANAKASRIARRWLAVGPDADGAPVVAGPLHRLRIDATPGDIAVLDGLRAGLLGKDFSPCAAR